MSLEELRKSVLQKAKDKAAKIIDEAKKEAQKIIDEAQQEYKRRLETERMKALSELRERWNREYVSKSMETNMKLLQLKRNLLNNLVEEAKKRLKELTPEAREQSIKNLLKESVNQSIIRGKFIIKVLPKDMEPLKKALKELGLTEKVAGVEKLDEKYLGGLLLENIDKTVAIDNTYSTRLKRALSILYDEVNKEILKG